MPLPISHKKSLIKARLNLKIEQDLKEWAVEYARKNHTSISSMICNHFEELRQLERSNADAEVVRQI